MPTDHVLCSVVNVVRLTVLFHTTHASARMTRLQMYGCGERDDCQYDRGGPPQTAKRDFSIY